MSENPKAPSVNKPHKDAKELIQQCDGVLQRFPAKMVDLFRGTGIAGAQQKITKWIDLVKASIDVTSKSHLGIRVEKSMTADTTAEENVSMIFLEAQRRMPRPEEQSGIIKAAADYRQLVEYYRDLLEAVVTEDDSSFTLAPGIGMVTPPPPTQTPKKQ